MKQFFGDHFNFRKIFCFGKFYGKVVLNKCSKSRHKIGSTVAKGTCFFFHSWHDQFWGDFYNILFCSDFPFLVKNWFGDFWNMFNMRRQAKTTNFQEAKLVFILTMVGTNFLVTTWISGQYSVLATFMGSCKNKCFKKRHKIGSHNCQRKLFFFTLLTPSILSILWRLLGKKLLLEHVLRRICSICEDKQEKKFSRTKFSFIFTLIETIFWWPL